MVTTVVVGLGTQPSSCRGGTGEENTIERRIDTESNGATVLTAAERKEHTLNRIGYGPSRWAVNRYNELGRAGYIAEQLAQTLPAITQDDVFIRPKVERCIVEQRQLEAVLVDFWFNHFNVNASNDNAGRNNSISRGLFAFQNVAIGPNVLGVFADMLLATAKSPSMLRYLDNYLNRRPQTFNNGVVVGYNENYAREVMELHTIGVNGGYNEVDVQEATRILTGWGFQRPDPDAPEEFIYRSNRHDVDAKTVMGVDYPAGGQMEEGEALLTFLGTHPSAANYLTYKLCTRLVGESPPAAVLSAASSVFESTGGDLGAVTERILGHPSFRNPDVVHFRSKMKPPHRYVASALMGMGATQPSDWSNIEQFLRNRIIDAGDTPYFFAPPTGYPEAAGYWMSTASVLVRFEIAERIAYNNTLLDALIARTQVDGDNITAAFNAIETAIIPGRVSAETKAAILDHAAAAAMTNRQRISAIAHMLLCSPEFMRY